MCLPVSADPDVVLPGGTFAGTDVRGEETEFPQLLAAYGAVSQRARGHGRRMLSPALEVHSPQITSLWDGWSPTGRAHEDPAVSAAVLECSTHVGGAISVATYAALLATGAFAPAYVAAAVMALAGAVCVALLQGSTGRRCDDSRSSSAVHPFTAARRRDVDP